MQRRSFVGKGEVKSLATERKALTSTEAILNLEIRCAPGVHSNTPAVLMPGAIQSKGRVRFEAYEVDLRTGELPKHGRKLRLPGRPFQVLAMLLERPGELLTRKELQENLWPADTFVDFEHGVNAAIQTLRRTLSDSHKKPRYIETLPRRGYRFIAALEKVEPVSTARELVSAEIFAPAAAPVSEWVGKVATICDTAGQECVLLPISEEIFEELRGCETANDDLGRALLIAAEKLLLVPCGTEVKILDARNPARGCTVRILDGQFFGDKAFVPLANLQGLP
jgi:DNA-binding winged helix-turn-helix (wHTH) protein